jgi:hypothetical protein
MAVSGSAEARARRAASTTPGSPAIHADIVGIAYSHTIEPLKKFHPPRRPLFFISDPLDEGFEQIPAQNPDTLFFADYCSKPRREE